MAQYVEKDPRLAYDFIPSMLRYWQVSVTAKQVLFLNEVEEMLALTQPPAVHRMQGVLVRRLALCNTRPHFQVFEHTLFFWNNDYIVKLINQNRAEVICERLSEFSATASSSWTRIYPSTARTPLIGPSSVATWKGAAVSTGC